MLATIRTLLGNLNRVFVKDPEPSALRIRRAGGPLVWLVADEWLRIGPALGAWEVEIALNPRDGAGRTRFQAGLPPVTLGQVAAAIAATSGYTLETNLGPDIIPRAALCLLDGQGTAGPDITASLPFWTAPLWAVMDAYASELEPLRATCGAAPSQMVLQTAEGEWLEMQADLFNVPRKPGESDAAWGARTAIQALHGHGNNVAIEIVLEQLFGRSVTVDDTTVFGAAIPIYNGAYVHDGSQVYDAEAAVFYGAFNVTLYHDPATDGPEDDFRAAVRAAAEPLAAGGVQVVSIILSAPPPSAPAPVAPYIITPSQIVDSPSAVAPFVITPSSIA